MGAVNYSTSDYITLGLNANNVEEVEEQEYFYSLAENVLSDYNFYFFHLELKPGYYSGFTLDIENNFPVAFDGWEEKQDAQKEVTQLKKCLLNLCTSAGLVEVFQVGAPDTVTKKRQ